MFETGALALVILSFVAFGLSGRGLISAFFVAVLAVLSAIDVERRVLPNRIVLPSAAIILAAQVTLAPERAFEWTLSALGASLFLLVALAVYPAGIGMGDVKLGLLLGAALGSSVGLGLLVGMLAAAVGASVLLVRYGAAARKMAIPLGPFLAFGALVALFWGQSLPGGSP